MSTMKIGATATAGAVLGTVKRQAMPLATSFNPTGPRSRPVLAWQIVQRQLLLYTRCPRRPRSPPPQERGSPGRTLPSSLATSSLTPLATRSGLIGMRCSTRSDLASRLKTASWRRYKCQWLHCPPMTTNSLTTATATGVSPTTCPCRRQALRATPSLLLGGWRRRRRHHHHYRPPLPARCGNAVRPAQCCLALTRTWVDSGTTAMMPPFLLPPLPPYPDRRLQSLPQQLPRMETTVPWICFWEWASAWAAQSPPSRTAAAMCSVRQTSSSGKRLHRPKAVSVQVQAPVLQWSPAARVAPHQKRRLWQSRDTKFPQSGRPRAGKRPRAAGSAMRLKST
mmetsp:Transcript_139/g.360  ORF Transcript_139/g.360 Transcript_139/m.360 type:complete len:338 (-) Transcript_139:116-1129(-)